MHGCGLGGGEGSAGHSGRLVGYRLMRGGAAAGWRRRLVEGRHSFGQARHRSRVHAEAAVGCRGGGRRGGCEECRRGGLRCPSSGAPDEHGCGMHAGGEEWGRASVEVSRGGGTGRVEVAGSEAVERGVRWVVHLKDGQCSTRWCCRTARLSFMRRSCTRGNALMLLHGR